MAKLFTDRTGLTYAEKDYVVPRQAGGLKYRIFVNVLASVLIMCCAGSVYAWSIFVAPLKTAYGLSTAQTQLIFGFIIASFSITMLFVGRIERKYGSKIAAVIGAVLFSAGRAGRLRLFHEQTFASDPIAYPPLIPRTIKV